MVTQEVQKVMSFEDRIRDRIKQTFGELVTDQEMKQIVHRSIEDILFKDRTTIGRYNEAVKSPPLLQDILTPLIDVHAKVAVHQWAIEHEIELNQWVQQAVQDGISKAVLKAIDTLFADAMFQLQCRIQDQIRAFGGNS